MMDIFKLMIAFCVILCGFDISAMQSRNATLLETGLEGMREVASQNQRNAVRCVEVLPEPTLSIRPSLLFPPESPPEPPSGSGSPCPLLCDEDGDLSRRIELLPMPSSVSNSPGCGSSIGGNFSLRIGSFWRFPTSGGEHSCSDDDSDLLILSSDSGSETCYRRGSDAGVPSSETGGGLTSPQTSSICSDSLFYDSPVERSQSTGSLDI